MSNEVISEYFKTDFSVCGFDYNSLSNNDFTFLEIENILRELINRGFAKIESKNYRLWFDFVQRESIKYGYFDLKSVLVSLVCLESESCEYIYSFLSYLFNNEGEVSLSKIEVYTLINALSFLHSNGENICSYASLLGDYDITEITK